MDVMPLRLNSSSLTSSICALAAIRLQFVAMECQNLHMADSPLSCTYQSFTVDYNPSFQGVKFLYDCVTGRRIEESFGCIMADEMVSNVCHFVFIKRTSLCVVYIVSYIQYVSSLSVLSDKQPQFQLFNDVLPYLVDPSFRLMAVMNIT